MSDPTEDIRRSEVAEINAQPASRSELQAKHGKIWDTDQVREEFEVLGFMTPYVVVRRKRDDVKGSLKFQASPRFYFEFQRD